MVLPNLADASGKVPHIHPATIINAEVVNVYHQAPVHTVQGPEIPAPVLDIFKTTRAGFIHLASRLEKRAQILEKTLDVSIDGMNKTVMLTYVHDKISCFERALQGDSSVDLIGEYGMDALLGIVSLLSSSGAWVEIVHG